MDGNLQVDPEIHLPAPGMDVDIAYFYNTTSTQNGPFGYGRTLSPNLTAQASGSPAIVTLTRGSGAVVSYQNNGSGTFLNQTPGNLNTLTEDSVDGYWKESTPDGKLTAYPLNTTGMITSIAYAQDAVGNTQTFGYSSGLLQSIQEPCGRLVSFGYSSGLLQNIEDWAGRRTTFQYDSASASPKNLLTTVTGPTGCQTQYQHTTFPLAGGTSDWLLSGIVDPNGYGTSYSFDQQRRTVSRTVAGVGTTSFLYQPGAHFVVDALSSITTHLTNSNFAVTATTNPLNALMTFTRNANNQQTSQQDALGNLNTTSYDTAGNVNGLVNALGYRTTISHDAYNNPTSVQLPDGSVTTLIWGYAGSSFDTTGAKRRLQASVDGLGNTTSYGYTGRGQLASVQSPLGYVTSFGYDGFGNQITVEDPLGNTTTRSFDLAGNVIGVTNPLGNTWTTTFDAQNRPLMQIDPLGNTSTAAYDSVGNPVVQISPLGYRTSLSYNVFDKVVARTDALGNVWTNVWDTLGRQAAAVDPLGQHEHDLV